ncbi:DUF2929 family protein [Atopobacter sp. AH10]|uniref:YjzD family protein n=1 Tax=Atopobacter sp. AH10 TaxID=2315861 RepID=UPI000EF23875|nr:YjzD family protein [Atopobacter sp. AH10]RLK63227.1 DUF2929 family protein [Atopobacter sp. AH10]
MKYIVLLVWAFILTQMTFFLGSSLMGSPYSFTEACVTAILEWLLVVIISDLLHWFQGKPKQHPK